MSYHLGTSLRRPRSLSGTWTENATKAMQENPDYFTWWYSAKSIGLGVAVGIIGYFLGRESMRRGRRES